MPEPVSPTLPRSLLQRATERLADPRRANLARACGPDKPRAVRDALTRGRRALLHAIRAQRPAVLREQERLCQGTSASLADVTLAALKRWWRAISRRGQRAPRGRWRIGVALGGRGAGKTRTGANWLADQIERYPGRDWGIVAPTGPTAWDACVVGMSGLAQALSVRGIAHELVPSRAKVLLPEGGTVFVDGADDGAPTLQGRNLSGCWVDEAGLFAITQWKRAWLESIQAAVRIAPGPGAKASILATGTPKRGHPLIKWLLANADWIHRMTMAENAANLADDVVADLVKAYHGTSLERQELQGQYLEQVEGALWKLDWIEAARVALAPALSRVVVAVDPSVTSKATSDTTGIIGMGIGTVDGHGYVLGDWSGKYTPDGTARRAIEAYRLLKADRIVIEANNGGDYLPAMFHTVDRNVPITMVHASRGKQTRADPVVALYQQLRVHHVGALALLEDELTSWDGSGESPGRLDSVVWAATFLMLKSKSPNLYFLD